jgi:hypothetical protein
MVRLCSPSLGLRGKWRFIVLNNVKEGGYRVYCIAAPNYRKQDLHTVRTISHFNLVRLTE